MINIMYSCNVTSCRRMTNLSKCGKCQNVYYCSEECQKYDLDIHQELCYPSLHDRLKALCTVITKYGVDTRTQGISDTRITVQIGYRLYSISIFPYTRQLHVPCCVICEKEVHFHMGEEFSLRQHIMFNLRRIDYYVCLQCKDMKMSLCNYTFLDRATCTTKNIYTIQYLFLSINYIATQEIPKDVIHTISKLMLCPHILQCINQLYLIR